MEHKIWYNGELIPYEEATVHILAHALHYGSSVFEGIRSYNTAQGPGVFRLSEHIRRLLDSAKIYRMDVPYSREELEEATLETIDNAGLKACYIRPIVFRGKGPMGVNPLQNPVETAIAVWEWGSYLGEEALNQGVEVEVASWNRMAPNTMPSLAKSSANYASAQLVKMDAVKNDFMEGIMLTVDGYVAEGSGENLFLVRDDRIYTAPSNLSILPGITRNAVIKLAKARGYAVEEKPITREALYIADELFFTGTAAEVTPIRAVDHYTIGSGKRGPITRELQDAFFDVVREGNDPYGWLTPLK
jgi:branched-chain amino acid aminotransferase